MHASQPRSSVLWHRFMHRLSGGDFTDTLSPLIVGRMIAILVLTSVVVVVALAPILAAPAARTALKINACAAVVLGLLALLGPWDRYRWPMIILPLMALGHIAMGVYLAQRPETFLAFFVLVFAFTGLALPRKASIVLVPFATAAYVVPVLARGMGAASASLAALYIPVGVVTGESLAWLADKLRSTESGLRGLDRLKNEFIAMVAHDVRTPLTVIGGFAETLRDQDMVLGASDRQAFLDTIVRNTQRCTEFIENLLQFARIEAGEFRQIAKPFDLVGMARRLADELIAVHGIEKLTVHAAPNVPLALADESRQVQVLSNLLSNAVKFSAPGEPISVNIDHDGKDQIVVAVRDRGPGIRDEDVPKLFEKFTSLDADGPKHPLGTGLGLYICRKIIESGRGRLWVDTRPGRGATFLYTLPAAPAGSTENTSDLVNSTETRPRARSV
jgi:signal transduction histidine kinase